MDFGGTAMMGGGGPMITGTWINTRTGEEVTVRDSFMDGEDMIIFTTDGRQFTLNDFQDYVQQSEEEYDEHGNMISNTNGGGIGTALTGEAPKPHHKPAKVDAATVFAGMDKNTDITDESIDAELESVMQIANSGIEPEKNTGVSKETTCSKQDISSGMQAAMKVLHKADSPVFKVSVDWNKFPKNELLMCKEYFDTTDDDITKAIIGLFCTGHELEAAITKWLIDELK